MNNIETSELTRAVKIKETFDFLYLHQRDLTAGQMDFVRGCKKQFARTKGLSKNQMKILIEIKKYLPDQDANFRISSGQLEIKNRINNSKTD